MIQFSALSRSTIDPPRRAASPVGSAPSLAAFLDALGDGATPTDPAPVKGKDGAAPGKPLPDEERTDEAALAWLAAMMPVQVPPPPPLSAGTIGGPIPLPVVVDAGTDTPSFALSEVEGQVLPLGFDVPRIKSGAERKVGESVTFDGTSKDSAAIPAVRNLEPDAKRFGQIATSVPQEAAAPVAAPTTPVTAAQVFGAVMREVERQDAKRADGDIAPLAPPAAQVEAQRHAVIATGEAQQAPLDMGNDRWPHRMIERIESMRDAADAVDTRIRLVPDALGAIDVSMRREGDAVHVHFAAEQAATARLLLDAQPRLAELAEARGIRLGGSAVDSGGADARRDRAPSPAPLPQAPARVVAEQTTDDDARIA